ncbi:hypothetical protein [Micromonospora chersina]|uniref:hypothetical protein n=1 Tax=Micromonospora chersina TaxID=47854 RepID=UPI001B2270D2|nr:hypothetical protein Nm8I071_38760 [Nonomuraea sp. TT08I-71]
MLTDAVPADLRKSFERLRYQHGLGVVDYEQFIVVADAAIGLYEPALRARFIEFYRGQAIPLNDEEGRPQPVTTDSYDDIAQHCCSCTKNRTLGSRYGFSEALLKTAG